MPNKSAGLTARALAVFSKDMRVELRSKYAFNAILMFGVTTLAVVSFTLGQSGLSSPILAALFWIIMFFLGDGRAVPGFCPRGRGRHRSGAQALRRPYRRLSGQVLFQPGSADTYFGDNHPHNFFIFTGRPGGQYFTVRAGADTRDNRPLRRDNYRSGHYRQRPRSRARCSPCCRSPSCLCCCCCWSTP